MSEILKADGFDDAIVGQCSVSLRLVYDINKMANILVSRDDMTLDDAMDYVSYNCIGAYVGEMTPIFISEYELQ